MDNQNDRDIYVIPPNFVDTGTFFGGMFKVRNVIEAGVLAGATGIPIFLFLPAGLTVRVIVLCLTSLPLALLALIGISGESLTSFLAIFLKYVRNRRVVGGEQREEKTQLKAKDKMHGKPGERRKESKPDYNPGKKRPDGHLCYESQSFYNNSPKRSDRKGGMGRMSGWKRTGEEDFPEEFDQIKAYEIRQKIRPGQRPKSREEKVRPGQVQERREEKPDSRRHGSDSKGGEKREAEIGSKGRGGKREAEIGSKGGSRKREAETGGNRSRDKVKEKHSMQTGRENRPFRNPVAEYLPIAKIENGIIYTRDHRYVKVVEVIPINFLLRSAREQRGIIYSFISYLKISPARIQFKVLTRRADIGRHINTVRKEMAQEDNGQCRLMQEDYLQFVQQISSREAVTRRFFLIFEYEPWDAKRGDEEAEALSQLQGVVHTASNYLRQCGNEVVIPENEDEFMVELLYNMLCRNESAEKPLSRKAQEVMARYQKDMGTGLSRRGAGDSSYQGDGIPASEFFVPQSIDFTHGHYICMDGMYYAWLMVPSDGYRIQVPAGWLSLMVNAGDGIDLDMFLSRQPKEQVIQKVGQQLRINRSRIKDASDTNTDFDDIDSAIRSGYFLKEGLANNEDFYYMNLLITVTAAAVDDLEWKVNEMKKLLLSQDMRAVSCDFREEQAFLSVLPLVSMEKKLYERSKRNLLTGGRGRLLSLYQL